MITRMISFLCILSFVGLPVYAGITEARNVLAHVVPNPGNPGEFQILVKFDLPELPQGSRIDHVYLAFIERDVIPAAARDSVVMANLERGMVNRGREPIGFVIRALATPNFVPTWKGDSDFEPQELSHAQFLPDDLKNIRIAEGGVQDERLQFDVTEFVREIARGNKQNNGLVIVAQRTDRAGLAVGRAGFNLGRIDVKLVMYYTEALEDPFGR